MHRIRFRPTTNGPLHIGGAFTAFRCWDAAQQYNGDFVLIEDDVVVLAKYGSIARAEQVVGQTLEEIRDERLADLEWLGIAPDAVHFASEFAEAHEKAAAQLGLRHWKAEGRPLYNTFVEAVNCPGGLIPYHAWLVAGRVSDDHELGVTGFVRGADLIYEAQLYDHFARTLYGMSYQVLQAYMPIVVTMEDWNVYSKKNPVQDYNPGDYPGDIKWLREIGLDGAWLHEVFLRGNVSRQWSDEENENLWQPVERIQATGEIGIPDDLYAEIERCAEAQK